MSEVVIYHQVSNPGITLSAKALEHILAYLQKQPGSQGVRFAVKKTGCSGFSYVVDYVTTAVAEDIVFPLAGDYHIYIDKNSYPFLKGVHLDYIKQGLNSKLEFTNPNQTGQCGCGESFTVK